MKKLFSVLLVMAMAVSAMAQVTTSAISGTVVDGAGKPAIGATVLATHVPSGTQYGAAVDAKGNFRILNIRPGGPYTVKTQMIGYKSVVDNGISIPLGDNYIVKTTLSEESQDIDAVVVSATGSGIMNSDRMGAVTNVNTREISTLPTISRSVSDFTRLTPQAGNSGSFAGRDTRYNSVNVDGAQFQARFGLSTSNNLPGGDAQPIALDAIQEISVNIAPFDIRQSSFTGASINAVTRSGDNKFQGSAYTYFRPKSFTGEKVGDQIVKNAKTDTKKIFGATLGGPIVKDKLFFFLSGEYEKTQTPGVSWRPSKDGVGNSASNTSRTNVNDMKAIYDYLTTKSTGKDWTYDPGAYDNFKPFESKNYKILARVDWNISKNHKLMVRYNEVKSNNDVATNSTSGPSPTGSTSVSRIGVDALAFSGAWYGFEDRVRSITGELNSKFSETISNKFLATYTSINTVRTTPNDQPFPFVDIYKDGKKYTTFGTELFSHNNEVVNKNFTITNNTTFSLNDHAVTAGLSYEYQYFANAYMREGTSMYAYDYNDVFSNGVFSMTNAAPKVFAYQLGYPGNETPTSEISFGTFSAYIQDEWNVTDRFKLTAGVRLEVPIYQSELEGPTRMLVGGKYTKETDLSQIPMYDGKKLDLSRWPKSRPVISPRVGFNWDVYGDRSLQVRGGSGIFSGLCPFVWFTNQAQTAGFVQSPEVSNTNASSLTNIRFNPNYRDQVFNNENITPPTKGVAPKNSQLAGVDPDFKMPLVWRTSLAADIKLPWNMIGTIEGIVTKDINNVIQQNIHLGVDEQLTPMGPDSRAIMNKLYPNISSLTMLTNGTKRGYSTSLTLQLTKKFSNGFTGMIAYTYNNVKDLGANPGSVANSAFTASANVGNSNDPALSFSNFSMPHRVNGFVSYSITWLKHATSTFAVYYNGTNQGRLQYTFANKPDDVITGVTTNTTGGLIYIPKNLEESKLLFADQKDNQNNVTYSAADQANDFETYINGNKYLKSRRGKYAERYGDIQPWVNRFDFKFTQDLFTNFGSDRRYTLQFTWDVLNVGNLLNKNWGAYQKSDGSFLSYENFQVLKFAGIKNDPTAPNNGWAQYTLNAGDTEKFKKSTTWIKNATTGSTWGMQMGFRLKF